MRTQAKNQRHRKDNIIMDAIIIAVIGVIGVILGGLITNHFLKPKVRAETEKLASDTWEKLANKMESRVEKLEIIVEKQEKKNNPIR